MQKIRSKKHCKKSSDDDSLAPKHFCMLHTNDDHWTIDCTVVKDQVTRMCAAWSAQSPAECSGKKLENKCQENDKSDML
jgi:hypothetical protein